MYSSLVFIVPLLSHVVAVYNCGGDYYGIKTKEAMANPGPGLRILVAHRGVEGPNCAESSRCSIDKAAEAAFEAIELDVRQDKDGMLWLTHDTRIGRTTSFRHDGWFFNPWRDNEFGPKNPAYSDMHSWQLSMLHYRDKDGHLTSEPLRNLESQLQFIKFNHRHMLVMFDVKSPAVVEKLAAIIRKLRMEHQTLMKIPIWYFRPQDLTRHTGGLSFTLGIEGDWLDAIALDPRNRVLGRTPQHRVQNYIRGYIHLPGFVAMEPPAKQFAQTRRGTVPVGPFAFVDNYFGSMRNVGFGRFHSVPTAGRQGYFDANGHCCVALRSMMSKSKVFGNQQWDDREKVTDLLKTAYFVTSDDDRGLMSAAQNMGFRRGICRITGPA